MNNTPNGLSPHPLLLLPPLLLPTDFFKLYTMLSTDVLAIYRSIRINQDMKKSHKSAFFFWKFYIKLLNYTTRCCLIHFAFKKSIPLNLNEINKHQTDKTDNNCKHVYSISTSTVHEQFGFTFLVDLECRYPHFLFH